MLARTLISTSDYQLQPQTVEAWKLAEAANMPQATVLFLFIAGHRDGCDLTNEEICEELGWWPDMLASPMNELATRGSITFVIRQPSKNRNSRVIVVRTPNYKAVEAAVEEPTVQPAPDYMGDLFTGRFAHLLNTTAK